jgi:hypothetical protein
MNWRYDLEVQPDHTVHVRPEADIIEHEIEPGTNCPCGPFLEEQPNGVALVIHHSLDGRELREAGL